MFQDKYPAFRSSRLRVSSYYGENQISAFSPSVVYINRVNFLVSDWKFVNVNVDMINSNSSKLTLDIKPRKQTFQLNLNVNNCTLGNWTLDGITNISIVNSRYNVDQCLGMKILHSTFLMKNMVVEQCSNTKSLILLHGSHGRISSSTFTRNRAQGLIFVAMNSSLMIENCNIHENTLSVNSGAIVTMANSYCQIENSYFRNNIGGALYLRNQAVLHVGNSTFINNRADFGGAILGMTFAKISIFKTTFSQNNARSLMAHRFNRTKDRKTFTHDPVSLNLKLPIDFPNLATQFGSYGGAIACVNVCALMVSESTFTQNHAQLKGGAIAVGIRSEVTVTGSTFSNNTGHLFGGAILVVNESDLTLESSFFYNNSAVNGGALIVQDGSATLENIRMTENNAMSAGGALMTTFYVTVTVTNSEFLGNIGVILGGGAFYSEYDSHVFVRGSKFTNNSTPTGLGGAIYLYQNSTIEVKDTLFNKNLAGAIGGGVALQYKTSAKLNNVTFYKNGGDGVINSQANCSLTVTNCLFVKNVASIVSIVNSTLNVSHSTFIQNSPVNDKSGGIFAQMTNVTLMNVTFQKNSATSVGAALCVLWYSNVTMENCMFKNNTVPVEGGAVYVADHVRIAMTKCTFFENQAQKDGGGVMSIKGSGRLSMKSCIMEENQSETGAGAIQVSDRSNVAMFNCIFKGNRAGLAGGAVSLSNSNLLLANTSFQANSASLLNGGGISASTNCIVNIINCLFANNTAPKIGSGGAIFASNSVNLHVQNGTFLSNYAGVQAGAIFLGRNSSLMLKDSRFSFNYNNGFGGAVTARNCTVVAYNSIFEGNIGKEGGCICVIESEVFFTNCTINDNVASTDGGAVFMRKVKLRIASTFLTNNSASKDKGIFIEEFSDRHLDTSSPSELLTYKSIFKDQNTTVSTKDNNFKQEALKHNFIFLQQTDIDVYETPYASGTYLITYLGYLSSEPISSNHP